MAEYEELIEALRHCYEDDDACATCQRWLAHDEWGIKCKGRLISDAAAAIEELQAQLPKRGKWIEDAKTYAGPGLSNYKCSLCGKICGTWRRGLEPSKLPNWCGNCGADMRKMEVQVIKSVTMREGDTDTDGFFRKAAEAVTEVQE